MGGYLCFCRIFESGGPYGGCTLGAGVLLEIQGFLHF